MKLTDKQIESIMTKQVVCKTILVDNNLKEKTISNHKKEGWKLVKETEINGRTKLTFEK